MKRKGLFMIGSWLVIATALIGCGREVSRSLEIPGRLTLYSIDGNSMPDHKPGQNPDRNGVE
jgi:hypothetical protein